jgi:hypothetical protein
MNDIFCIFVSHVSRVKGERYFLNNGLNLNILPVICNFLFKTISKYPA